MFQSLDVTCMCYFQLLVCHFYLPVHLGISLKCGSRDE